ncbi:MAG: SDR family oxidoreductase [Kofleriaceae bacterium]
MTTYAITGATGHLGRLVISALLARNVKSSQIVALARDPGKASILLPKGVVVRLADYDKPETLGPALAGIDKLLLISANEVGRRLSQHRSVIEAAKQAGVKLVAYTSILRADRSTISLATEHLETEKLLRASGLPFVFLRNGWYIENYTASLPAILEHKTQIGGSGVGRISAATRADYAEAAAAVLVSPADQNGKIYELAGDISFTRYDFAAELSKQIGSTIQYRDLAEADFRAALETAGVPQPVATILAQADAAASLGELYDQSGDLNALIGRDTTPLSTALASALSQRA